MILIIALFLYLYGFLYICLDRLGLFIFMAQNNRGFFLAHVVCPLWIDKGVGGGTQLFPVTKALGAITISNLVSLHGRNKSALKGNKPALNLFSPDVMHTTSAYNFWARTSHMAPPITRCL